MTKHERTMILYSAEMIEQALRIPAGEHQWKAMTEIACRLRSLVDKNNSRKAERTETRESWKTEVQKAIDEFSPLYGDVTTSDLQGICEARAMQICRKYKVSGCEADVSDKIIEGIYDREAKIA